MFVALSKDAIRFRGFVVELVAHQEIMVSLRSCVKCGRIMMLRSS